MQSGDSDRARNKGRQSRCATLATGVAGTHLPAELRLPSPWYPPSVSAPPDSGHARNRVPEVQEAVKPADMSAAHDARLESRDVPNFSFR